MKPSLMSPGKGHVSLQAVFALHQYHLRGPYVIIYANRSSLKPACAFLEELPWTLFGITGSFLTMPGIERWLTAVAQ